MKNIQSIISNLKHTSLKKLNTTDIINKLILTFPKALQEKIVFGTLKGDTLLLATTHISVSAEINKFRTDDILNTINLICESFESQHLCDCNDLDEQLAILRKIKKVKAYVPKKILENRHMIKESDIIIIECYKERALGTFSVNENSKFKDIFNTIKSAILRNNDEIKR